MSFLKRMKRAFGGGDKKPSKGAPVEISEADERERARAALSNQQAREELQASQQLETGQFRGAHRGAAEIEESGVLAEFAKIDTSKLEKKSEFKRTIDDDAALVRKGFSSFSPQQIEDMKSKAYAGSFDDERDGRNTKPTDARTKKIRKEGKGAARDAAEKGHFGSELHKEYGAMVEYLSGGLISAEEAMVMNPTGGIAGPGAKGIAFEKDNALRRHAVRHDAVGFLKTRFDVGPGYGTKTSAIGLKSSNPLAGQWLGIGRELIRPDERFDTSNIGTSARLAGTATVDGVQQKRKR